MARLLLVHPSPTCGVRALTDAVLAGAHDDAIIGVEVMTRPALSSSGSAEESAGGTHGRPFGLYVHRHYDTAGAVPLSDLDRQRPGLASVRRGAARRP